MAIKPLLTHRLSTLFGRLSLLTLALLSLTTGQAQVSITSASAVTTTFDQASGTAMPSGFRMTSAYTTTTSSVTTASTTINVTSSANLVIGMAVTGTGVAGGATISAINSATQIVISASSTIANAITLTFSNGNIVTYANTSNVTSTSLQTTSGSVTGGSYSYYSGTDRAIGAQGSGTFPTPQSLMVNYRNNSAATIKDLQINFKIERYRINTVAPSLDFFYSTDGTSWIALSAANAIGSEFSTAASSFTFPTTLTINKTATISNLNLAISGNVFFRWALNLANANSQGISIDDVVATPTLLACATPADQPTALTFPTTGTGQITGSFTAAASLPTNYLVVRYLASATATNPTDGVVYTSNSALGTGTIISVGTGTSFISTGLAISTSYDYYVYSYNNLGCTGGPKYRTTTPLKATKSTNGCPTFAATIQIDAVASRVDGSVYNTITDALLDLSGCAVSQPTVIQLNSNYVSTGETFPLTLAAIAGASSTNTITIRPASGATNLSITGSSLIPATQGSIIYLSGGLFWQIDGRAGGAGTTRNLTIENTDNTTSGSAAVRFINSAQNNLVTYCNVKSANIASASGCINFSLNGGGSGNSNNTISFCNVSESSTGLPYVGISSIGVIGGNNDNNSILNNNIFNVFNAVGNTYGIYLSDYTTNWTITGNSIYQTASRVQTSGSDRNFAPIGISPSDFSTVTGNVISGNFIGGTAPLCGGTPLTISDNGSSTIVFRGIFAQVGTAVATSIQGNTIANINVTSSSTSSNQSCISAVTGSFNIGTSIGNILGSQSGANSVTLTQTTATTAARLSGIIAGTGTPGVIQIQNNLIGGLTASNSFGGTLGLAGIYAMGAATSYNITGNLVGSTTTGNSIRNNTANDTWGIYLGSTTTANTINGNTIVNLNAGTGRLIGIRTDGGVNTTTQNTIRNCTSASTGLTGCIGIWQNGTSAGQTISRNVIHSLSNTDGTAAATAQGIYYTGPTSGTNLIDRNYIHSLALSTVSVSGAMYGIRVLTGSFPVTIQNNMVRLGIDAAGADITTGYSLFGISNASSGAINHYFNTVYIGGASVSGTTANTFALLSSGTGNTRSFLNNLLVNARSGGATGSHYCLSIGGTGVNPTGLSSNNNLYQATGINGFMLSYASTNLDDLGGIRTTTGQDANTVSCDPKLINPTGTFSSLDLHISAPPVPTLIEGNGLLVGSVNIDFDGQTRSALSPTDIGADAGDFTVQLNGCTATWNGSVSTAWTNKDNWTPDITPIVSTPVVIPAGVPNSPMLNSTANCATLTMTGDATLNITIAGQLRVSGAITATAANSIVGLGKLVCSGAAAQALTGTLNLSNLEIANTSSAGVEVAIGAVVLLTPTVTIGTGKLTMLANTKLTNNGTLTLKSNTNGTAMIGTLPSTASIVGNITLERLTPTTPGWYMIGAPFKVGTTINEWSEMTPLITPKQLANVLYYTETDTTRFQFGNRAVEANGWKVATALTNDFNPSNTPRGYRIYLNNIFMTTGNATLSVTGQPFTQDVSVPFTKSANGFGGGGWNFISNPYPCAIDWNVTKFDAANSGLPMTNSVHIWNGATANYGTWTALSAGSGTGVGISSGLIASSQSFFIKANAASTLTFKESFKNTAAVNSLMRTASQANLVKFRLIQGTKWDEASVLFYDGADNADDQFDADNLAGSALDLSTTNSAGRGLAINIMATLAGQHIIPITANTPAIGNTTLSFEDLSGFDAAYELILIDLATNTQTDLRLNPTVQFVQTSTQSPNRFRLLVRPTITGLSNHVNGQLSLSLWPNPADNGNNITLTLNNFSTIGNNQAIVRLIDVLGKVVMTQSINLNEFGMAQLALPNTLNTGIYTLNVGGQTKQLIIR